MRRGGKALRTRTVAAAVGVVSVVVAVSTTDIAAAQPATACTPSWQLMTKVPLTGGDLDSVQALSATDIRFAGDTPAPWVARSNGQTVRATTPVPTVPIGSQVGGAASFDSASDGWMHTSLVSGSAVPTDTIERWHAGRWTMLPLAVTPDPTTEGMRTLATQAITPSDAWTVGYYYAAAKGVTAGAQPIGALIERWDGTQWNVVANPLSSQPGTVLKAVTAASADDIWAVGEQTDADGSLEPLAEHWDGRTWSVVATPSGVEPAALQTVTVIGGEAWAAGGQTTDGLAVPLVEHWDGTAWQVAGGLPDIGNSEVTGIYAANAHDVWATAQFGMGVSAAFLHWNGTKWTAVATPGLAAAGATYLYSGIDGTGPHDIWAVGEVGHHSTGVATPQIAHLSCAG